MLLIVVIGMNGLLNMKIYVKKRKKNVYVKQEVMRLMEHTMILYGLFGIYYFTMLNQIIQYQKIKILYLLFIK